MQSKIIPLLLFSLLLSSCCWLVKVDCAESEEAPFTIPVEFAHSDSILQVTDTLSLKIRTAEFSPQYINDEFQNSTFYVDIIWFNGDFSSSANTKVDLISSSVGQFSLDEYEGYYGPLPNDIDLSISFTIPGYYLILFNGSSYKDYEQKRRNRCSCGNYSYLSFNFESDVSNEQFYPMYENSAGLGTTLEMLNHQGAYFIKVE